MSRKLDMADRVLGFLRKHASGGTSQEPRLAKLEGLIRRADTLRTAERDGRYEEASAANRRRELRRTIQGQLLPHLVRVGKLAPDPAVAGKFHLRSPDATNTSFLSSSKAMLALAEAHKAEFLGNGLEESLLADLAIALAEFDGTMVQGRAGRTQHIQVRAELDLLGEEVGKTVGQIDGLNRYRFRSNPELLAAWDAVRRIGPRTREKPVAPTTGGEIPPAGGIAPAA